MHTACIALGSNLGDRGAHLNAAVERLRAEPGVRVLKVSNYYETIPIDCPPSAGSFLNAAMVVETSRSPESLLALLLLIEHRFGRIRVGPNSPRTLDLDLLFHDDRALNTPELMIPHPRLHQRAFVLIPLAEIAPDYEHPTLRQTIRQLVATLPQADREMVKPYKEPPAAVRALAGMRALVTGSSAGIGRAIALAFAQAGAEVIVHGRDRSGIEETVELCSNVRSVGGTERVTSCRADLSDPGQCDHLAAETWAGDRGIDVLVCNAGADVLTGQAGRACFDEKLEALLAVDVRATMRLSRDLGARMKARGRGCVLTIGWDQAETGMEGDSGQLFAATKGAVICFTRSLALSLAPEVRVNCIAPGWIRTAWGETASEAWQERVRQETPLGIWGLPEDVAAAAVWLASPSARFITGQTIRVNGGAV